MTAVEELYGDLVADGPGEIPGDIPADAGGPAALDDGEVAASGVRSGRSWSRVVAIGLLPALALLLAVTAGYLKWVSSSGQQDQLAGRSALDVATDSTVTLLSYTPDSAPTELRAARDRLTGQFKESYTSLIEDVVIPGSKQQLISSQAKVVAAAPVSADPQRTVVLLFVNQTVTVGDDPPTESASSVRVTLDKVGERWLISQFDPV